MLGTNMFFWDWLGAPIRPDPILESPPAAPGPWGSKRGHDYHPLPDEYWEHREARMTEDRKTPREIFDDAKSFITATPDNTSGIAGIAERKKLLTAMTGAGSVDDLKAIAARLRDLRKRT